MFLAIVPIVVGFLAVQSVQYLNNLYFINRLLGQIERAYVDSYPLFEWEHRYGVSSPDRPVIQRGINWSIVPQFITLILAALGYIGSIYAAYVVWPPRGIDILVSGLTRGGLLGIYLVLTGLVGLAGYSFYLHKDQLTAPKLERREDADE